MAKLERKLNQEIWLLRSKNTYNKYAALKILRQIKDKKRIHSHLFIAYNKHMKNILIAEEDEEIRNNLVEELRNMSDYNYVLAADGVTAYQKCRNQEFAVILMSYTTKKITGFKLVDAIRENNINAYCHIVIYTKDVQLAKVECQDLKNIYFVEKPADYDQLCDRIHKLANTDPSKKKFKLDVDFVNPFIDSAIATLNEMCGVNDIQAQKPHLLAEDELNIQISGSINVASPFFKGTIALSFNREVYEGIIAQMLEVESNTINIETDDGAAEILNVIYGRSKVKLNEHGYRLQRVIPKVIRGQNHKISPKAKIPTLLVPFASNAGDFYIQICVQAI